MFVIINYATNECNVVMLRLTQNIYTCSKFVLFLYLGGLSDEAHGNLYHLKVRIIL